MKLCFLPCCCFCLWQINNNMGPEETVEENLLTVEEVKHRLSKGDIRLDVPFKSDILDDSYRKGLQQQFPSYHVFYFRWLPRIVIQPSISTANVLEQITKIHYAACSFRADAERLMRMLGRKYAVDSSTNEGLVVLRTKCVGEQKKGRINAEWTYWFHGAECRFRYQRTGQVVEIVIIFKTEYGALDTFFFQQYLKNH